MHSSKLLRVISVEPLLRLTFHQNESGLLSLGRVSLAEYPHTQGLLCYPFSGLEYEFCEFPACGSVLSAKRLLFEEVEHRWAWCCPFLRSFWACLTVVFV